ncbi:phosphatase PAP2 family protein [Streptomyces sp. HPF1205]|uniref:phosphatase PAP2 family protein n=1 Tax=Streptomyces sp. HPF1205 TaxID=2873262 RepID=UPI001CED8A2E|nr:phosphatase PAP2 family protein [Streptomyces sp. HPF1205]
MTSQVDAGLYRWVVTLTHHAPQPLNDTVKFFSDFGLGLFAVLMLIAWWRARPADSARMAAALSVPLIVVAVYLVNDLVKSGVDETRPCRTLHTVTLEACPGPSDWSFPSNHSAIAAAAAVALLFASRRIGWYALALALLMGASRVWIGVHYPHDVLVGLVLGALVAWPLALAAPRLAPVVERLRGTRLLGPALLAPGPQENGSRGATTAPQP